jgi:hypothetical protein
VLIGGSGPAANLIAYHTDNAVEIGLGTNRVSISQNSMFGNGFGINLEPGFVTTPNDPQDVDNGANLLQNFPVLTSAVSTSDGTTIAGTLNSEPSSNYRIEFFASPTCNASGNGEGEWFLGAADVVTNSVGDASFSVRLPRTLLSTDVVTATATDAFGDTSEFSACQQVISTTTPLAFFVLAPCRVVDTRDPNGVYGGPALAASSTRIFPLAGRCGIPSTARALSANITDVEPTDAGFLLLFEGGQDPPPSTSTINFTRGQTRGNNVRVPLSHDGSGSVAVQNASPGAVHLILDVNGYFE